MEDFLRPLEALVPGFLSRFTTENRSGFPVISSFEGGFRTLLGGVHWGGSVDRAGINIGAKTLASCWLNIQRLRKFKEIDDFENLNNHY